MVHEQFDLARFQKMFPLQTLRQQAREYVLKRQKELPSEYPDEEAVKKHIGLMEPGGEIVTSPYDMAVVEQVRAEVIGDMEVERVATDAFVFGKEEPTDRRVTKIGGLPYRDRKVEWPCSSDGPPMNFIGQMCFADSRFAVGDLPGDLLLVFSDKNPLEESVDSFIFEWQSMGGINPVTQRDVPDGLGVISPCYGVLHRTYDYMVNQELFGGRQSYLLPRIQGTKIGGLPNWIQNEEEPGGRFLCTIGSIQPAYNRAFPYVNVETPLEWSLSRAERLLMWGDMGCLYLFIDDDGEIHWTEQCY